MGAVMSQELFPIEDKTPNGSLRQGVGAVRQIMLHRYRPLYVESARRARQDECNGVSVSASGGYCRVVQDIPRDIASNVRLLASGDGPSWRLVVTDASAVLELPDKVSMKLPAAAFKTGWYRPDR